MGVIRPMAIDFTAPEAALLLGALVALADDDPSDAEGVVLRRYYRHETAESAQRKLAAAGFQYPADLAPLEPDLLAALAKADEDFRLRTLAVAYELARADGVVDPAELRVLARLAAQLQSSLADADRLIAQGIPEIDERGDYKRGLSTPPRPVRVELEWHLAAALLAGLIAFADDDPSEREAAVIREHFGEQRMTRAIAEMEAEGLAYPRDLEQLMPSIIDALDHLKRDCQLWALAVAYATAEADGAVDAAEEAIIRNLCERFFIGYGEVREYFQASPVG